MDPGIKETCIVRPMVVAKGPITNKSELLKTTNDLVTSTTDLLKVTGPQEHLNIKDSVEMEICTQHPLGVASSPVPIGMERYRIIRVEDHHIHEVVSKLMNDQSLETKFVSFMTGLGTEGADFFRLLKMYQGQKPPLYDSIHECLTTWKSQHVESETTLAALQKILSDLGFVSTVEKVGKYCWRNKINWREDAKGKLKPEHLGEVAGLLEEDESVNGNFVRFIQAFKLGVAKTHSLQSDFLGRRPTATFYETLSDCLKTWKSHQSLDDANYSVLLRVLNENRMTGARETLVKYLENSIISSGV